jgi:hypothetical protein
MDGSAGFDGRFEILDEMPADGLAFAVFVGCEIDRTGVLHQAPEFFNDLGAALSEFVGGLEVVVDIDSQSLRRKVGDVTHGGLDFIVGTEK